METKKKAKIVKEDRISALPDEILIYILSLLTVTEAQKTSVLSTRWRYLWKHITRLNFSWIRENGCVTSSVELIDMSLFVRDSNFINWVYKVCSLVQSPTIEQFIIRYKFNENVKDSVNKLVDIAIEKGVKDLELTIFTVRFRLKRWERPILSCRPVSSGFKRLRSLNLNSVNISGETVEHFLLHCSSLEKISIEGSQHLRTLKVGGPLCNLKFLKIFNCRFLTDLLIWAPKLSNFQYQGRRINLHIENISLLSHVCIAGVITDCLTWAFCALSTQLSQILTLELCLSSRQACSCNSGCCAWRNTDFPLLSKLSSLRELTVRVYGQSDKNLIFLLSFLKVSPFLEKFKLEVPREEFLPRFERSEVPFQSELSWSTSPHQYLNVLEVANFFACRNTTELVKHITRAAPKLEKVVIDPMPLGKFSPSGGRILYTKQFEELFEEVITQRIDQKIEFIL